MLGRRTSSLVWISALAATLTCAAGVASAQNQLLMHYMPWFQSPEYSGFWGKHWTGWNNEADPDQLDEFGLPDIHSNYHPLIGPYDSSDPDAIECHLLWMKLAGVDGVIVDWYGTSGLWDYPLNHAGTQAMFTACGQLDMDFAICFEDRTVEALVGQGWINTSQIQQHLTDTFNWMQNNWFTQPQYVQKDGRPLLLNFGPIYVSNGSHWNNALNSLPVRPYFYALHHLWQGISADGGFTWVHTSVWDGNPSQATIEQRLNNLFYGVSGNADQVIPSAQCGFDHVTGAYTPLDHRGGATLAESLQVAMDGPWEITQLVTWNDFGEGTMIEPTHEFGYTFLEVIQDARAAELGASFTFTHDDLRLPTLLFTLRKSGQHPDATLDTIASLLSSGDTAQAGAMLGALLGDAFEAQPIDTISDAGATLVFTVDTADELAGLTIQWERDGVPLVDDGRISGATTETLTIAQAGLDDVGVYTAVGSYSGIVTVSDGAIGAVRESPHGVADFNNDGTLSPEDVQDFIEHLESQLP